MHGRHSLVFLALLISTQGASAEQTNREFRPDPLTIQRHGPAYRYPQAGWIVLHIEGEPYERGFQHGRLLAEEIAAYIRCHAATQSTKAPEQGWKLTRTMVNALFLRRFDREYLEEMKGIADGAASAGARFDSRPIDLIDIAALNLWAELMTLDGALAATPTGLEGHRFPKDQPQPTKLPQPGHCSAFAATGPATADGKIVFGHISMFNLYPSSFFNVWLDVKPAKGHRVLMQSYPAGIYSGMDYYLNSAGLIVCETTINQTRFNAQGETLASRMRRALQYCDSIDAIVETLTKSNNGLYTNEWLLADTKTNEIAMFELGTNKTRLWRSSKNDWFGGTQGFYWGCNNAKDLGVRLDTLPGTNDRPADMVWRPHDRDMAWVKLYQKHKGKIDASFGREAFTTPPLCAFPSLDAKYTTADLAASLRTHAIFGPPLGRTWNPTPREMADYPEVHPMVSNPWTILGGDPPAVAAGDPLACDLKPVFTPPRNPASDDHGVSDDESRAPLEVCRWRGTLLPGTDADIWLASGSAELHNILSRELPNTDSAISCCENADGSAACSAIFDARARYLRAAAASGDVALADIKPTVESADWFNIASGKGLLLLAELRELLGTDRFDELMDAFGREHAGEEVTSAQFIAAAEKAAGRSLARFFDYWLRQTGLPTLSLGSATIRKPSEADASIRGILVARGGPLPARIQATLESEFDERTQTVEVDPQTGEFTMDSIGRPVRLVVDKYGRAARANGGPAGIRSFVPELENSLIVCGTLDDEAANRAAAEELQRSIIEAWSNIRVPILADTAVSDDELRSHHLLLIGRPMANKIAARFASAVPVKFGPQSFTICRRSYAHPDTALAIAGVNPQNRRYGITLLAGLSGASTLRAASLLMRDHPQHANPEARIYLRDGNTRSLVVPPPELVHEFNDEQQAAR